MLGIEISERTVSRSLQTVPRPPSQTWKTFLQNHVSQIVSVDCFTVPAIRLRVLFVFVVLEHRRQVLHFNVTDHPASAWVAQQMVEAFADGETPRYLIRDRDGVYGLEVSRRLETMRIEEVLTAAQSPWQNAHAERLIGSIRRECLNHFVILNARHLKRTLASYFRYYHSSRPHLGLEKECPIEHPIMHHGTIVEIPELGGLHHRYERTAAYRYIFGERQPPAECSEKSLEFTICAGDQTALASANVGEFEAAVLIDSSPKDEASPSRPVADAMRAFNGLYAIFITF